MQNKLTLQRQTLRNLSNRFLGRAAGGRIRQPGASDECPATLHDCDEPGGGAPTGRCDLVPTIAVNGC